MRPATRVGLLGTLSLFVFFSLLRSPVLLREAGRPVMHSEGGVGGPALDEPPSFSLEEKGHQEQQGGESGGAEEQDGADKHVGGGTDEPSRAGELVMSGAAAAVDVEDPARSTSSEEMISSAATGEAGAGAGAGASADVGAGASSYVVLVLQCPPEKPSLPPFDPSIVFMAHAYAFELEQLSRGRIKVSVELVLVSGNLTARQLERALVTLVRVTTRKPCADASAALRQALQQRFSPESLSSPQRLFTVVNRGEVFASNEAVPCGLRSRPLDKVDIMLDRTTARTGVWTGECSGLHYVQGLQFQSRSAKYAAELRRTLCDRAVWSAPPPARRAEDAFVLATMKLIKRGIHSPEALVRSTVFGLLARRLGPGAGAGTMFVKTLREQFRYRELKECGKDDLDTAVCKRGFSLSIDMENSGFAGYMSEKLFTGLIARALPIYYGAPDMDTWINPRRVVRCELNSTVREWLNEQKSGRDFVHFLPLKDYEVTDAMLHEYMLATLGPHLEGCVDRAIALLRDAEAYAKVLAEPPLRDQRWCAQQPWIFGDLGANTVRLLHRTLKVPWPAELSDEDLAAAR
jgi:hypothetical protein